MESGNNLCVFRGWIAVGRNRFGGEEAVNQMQLNFANNVKREMAEQGYDTYGLAKKVSVYPSTIYRLIHHERGVSLELATKLSQALGLTLDDLIKPTFKRSEVDVTHARRLAELNRGGGSCTIFSMTSFQTMK